MLQGSVLIFCQKLKTEAYLSVSSPLTSNPGPEPTLPAAASPPAFGGLIAQ